MAKSDLGGHRVLVVEGESRIAMLIRDTLEDLGCKVVAMVSRLDDARTKAASLEFDIALLGVELSGESSFPMAHELAGRGTPLVLITGYGTTGIPSELKQVPVLQKPFRRVELERALLAALNC